MSEIAEPAQYDGRIETCTGSRIEGWAWDQARPDLAVEVELLIRGQLLAARTADMYRADLEGAGIGSGRHAFAFEEVPSTEEVSVRIKDSHFLLAREPSIEQIYSNSMPADPSSLAMVDEFIAGSTESTTDVTRLQANIALIMGWLQRNADRLTALKRAEALRFENLNQAVAEAGGLQGSVGHFYGILQQSYPQLVLQMADQPRVSIVIPVHNKFQLTYQCVKSIADAETACSFEVIIVDDASSDETLLSSLVFVGCFTIRTARNEGFVGACNLGSSRARGEYVLFLNNDTIVNDGWLDALATTLDRDPSIGIAGSRLLFPDGTLQESGGIIWRDGSGWNWGRGQDRMHPTYSFMRDADYVSGAALMIRRSLLEQLNGFDVYYSPAYYEDTDLCFRAREIGCRVVVQPASTIVHLEGQSNGVSTSAGLKRYQVVNAKKFRSRWAHALKSHRDNGIEPAREAERRPLKRALFIDETTPTPDRDAGSNAALEHMLSLQRLGFKVVFLPADNMASIPRYTQDLQALGIEAWYAPFAWSVEEYFRRNPCDFDLVYFHRKANLNRYLHLVKKYVPKARIVFNYADIHALRGLREAETLGDRPEEVARLERELEEELDLATKVDAVIVHSSFEQALIAERRPKARVFNIPWSVPTTAKDADPTSRHNISFVGGFGHSPNVDAVDWFVQEIWPLIWSRTDQYQFRIIGSQMPERFNSIDVPGVQALGFVDDLVAELRNTILTVAPLRFGAGLKGKVLTSFANGIPCIMTPVAAEGMDLPADLDGLVAADAELFADRAVTLINDVSSWQHMSLAGLKIVRDRYSSEAIDQLLSAAVII